MDRPVALSAYIRRLDCRELQDVFAVSIPTALPGFDERYRPTRDVRTSRAMTIFATDVFLEVHRILPAGMVSVAMALKALV
jgi:hypothetical protein